MADILVADVGGGLTSDEIMAKLTSGKTYVYLARNLMPAQADAVMEKITALFDTDHLDAVVTERQDLRQYPDGSASAALVGGTDYDGNGLSGVEAKFDTKLAGKDGERVVDVDARHADHPGQRPRRGRRQQTGMDINLTIDSDLQYTALQMLTKAVDNSQANSGCVVVMQVADAQVAAMACYEPGKSPKETGNRAVTDAIEPGSVNKVVTFAAALEKGLITPTTVLNVDGIDPGRRRRPSTTPGGTARSNMTATGILAKSSNVGTLMIAQQVGQDAFVDMAKKFGQGVKTGIQLPAETLGPVPGPVDLVGQHLRQPADRSGRVDHRCCSSPGCTRRSPTAGSGSRRPSSPAPRVNGEMTPNAGRAPTTQVMSAGQRAHPAGHAPRHHAGRRQQPPGHRAAGAPSPATRSPARPAPRRRSTRRPATTRRPRSPRRSPGSSRPTTRSTSVAIMLDDPKGDSPAGTTSCAPLFHDIAAYAMRAADVPPSATEAPVYDLYCRVSDRG